MERKLFVVVVCNVFFLYVLCAREQSYSALTEEEYEIMVWKIRGVFNTPVNERDSIEKSVLRKYYRWRKEGRAIIIGASEKTIYVDGRKLMKINDRDIAIKEMEKNSKDSGVKKPKAK